MQKLNISSELCTLAKAHEWRPWSCRASFRGMPRQLLGSWNFQHSVADCRFASVLAREGCWPNEEDFADRMPGLFADLSQHAQHQCRGNLGIHLVTCSEPYSFHQDRVLTPSETIAFLGWNKDVDMTGTDARTPWQHGPHGSKRSKLSTHTTLKDLIGNSVSLPDVGMVLACCLLASPCSAFDDATISSVNLIPGWNPAVYEDHEINPFDATPDMESIAEAAADAMLGTGLS